MVSDSMEGKPAFPTRASVLRSKTGSGLGAGGGPPGRASPPPHRQASELSPELALRAGPGPCRGAGFALAVPGVQMWYFFGCISSCRCAMVYLTIHFY